MKKRITALFLVLMLALLAAAGCAPQEGGEKAASETTQAARETAASGEGQEAVTADEVPAYAGEPYVPVNNNEPDFAKSDFTTRAFESYSELDALGRCGAATANIGTELMPREERGSIGQIKPSGWKTQRYDNVDGKYLYNRCHLIAFQLTGENANEKNLITGTREMNVEGMLPFENMVADYIKETGNHVLYRVTPIFEGENLLASGVQMEAESVEDAGEGICFNVYVYNHQQGIAIDYATGDSRRSGTPAQAQGETHRHGHKSEYVLNTNTHKFHNPGCSSVSDMKAENQDVFRGDRQRLLREGYEPCKNCNP